MLLLPTYRSRNKEKIAAILWAKLFCDLERGIGLARTASHNELPSVGFLETFDHILQCGILMLAELLLDDDLLLALEELIPVYRGILNLVESNARDGDLLADVRKKSQFLFDAFRGAPGIESVSGLGLMIGIKTSKSAGDVVKACMEQGVLCLTAKDKVRLLPALNIPMELLEKAAAIIKAACA